MKIALLLAVAFVPSRAFSETDGLSKALQLHDPVERRRKFCDESHVPRPPLSWETVIKALEDRDFLIRECAAEMFLREDHLPDLMLSHLLKTWEKESNTELKKSMIESIGNQRSRAISAIDGLLKCAENDKALGGTCLTAIAGVGRVSTAQGKRLRSFFKASGNVAALDVFLNVNKNSPSRLDDLVEILTKEIKAKSFEPIYPMIAAELTEVVSLHNGVNIYAPEKRPSDTVFSLLKHSDPKVRRTALHALAKLAGRGIWTHETYVSNVTPMLEDRDENVLSSALTLVSKEHVSHEFLPKLFALFKVPPQSVSTKVRLGRVLTSQTSTNVDSKKSVYLDELLETLKEATEGTDTALAAGASIALFGKLSYFTQQLPHKHPRGEKWNALYRECLSKLQLKNVVDGKFLGTIGTHPVQLQLDNPALGSYSGTYSYRGKGSTLTLKGVGTAAGLELEEKDENGAVTGYWVLRAKKPADKELVGFWWSPDNAKTFPVTLSPAS